MVELNPITLWRRLLALPNESRTKTVVIAFLVSAISAVVVSGAAVMLRPIQDANRAAESRARLEAMIATHPGMSEILRIKGADTLATRVVDLTTGKAAREVDPEGFDMFAAADDPETSTAIAADSDFAGIGRRPNHAKIHIIEDSGKLALVILPVYAVGYQSTIRGLLALEGDLNTVAGLVITEHGETPGLGARIEDRAWQDLWPGKQIADQSGRIVFSVARGRSSSEYEVDGITGATRTGNAVTGMIRFWLGENGYGPVLERLGEEAHAR